MSDCSGDWVTVSAPYLTPRADGQRDAWTDEAAQRGRSGLQELREVAEVDPPEDVAEALRLAAGEKVVVRRRTMLLDGQPIELTDSHFPGRIARGTALAEHRKIHGGSVTLLADRGYVADKAVEEITFRPAAADEAELLGLPLEAPVIVLFRTVLTAEGVPFEVSVMTMVPEGRRLRYQIRMG